MHIFVKLHVPIYGIRNMCGKRYDKEMIFGDLF